MKLSKAAKHNNIRNSNYSTHFIIKRSTWNCPRWESCICFKRGEAGCFVCLQEHCCLRCWQSLGNRIVHLGYSLIKFPFFILHSSNYPMIQNIEPIFLTIKIIWTVSLTVHVQNWKWSLASQNCIWLCIVTFGNMAIN